MWEVLLINGVVRSGLNDDIKRLLLAEKRSKLKLGKLKCKAIFGSGILGLQFWF